MMSFAGVSANSADQFPVLHSSLRYSMLKVRKDARIIGYNIKWERDAYAFET